MANLIDTIEQWGENHHSRVLDIIRIALGITLFLKGLAFIQDTSVLEQILTKNGFDFTAFMIAHYVAMAHLVGGVLMTMGLVTRMAAAFQIPVLLGAVFFVNRISDFSSINSEFYFSIMVLLLLVFFFISGSGDWSIDAYMRRNNIGKEN